MYRKPLTIDATLATLDWLKETDMATRLETAIAANRQSGSDRHRGRQGAHLRHGWQGLNARCRQSDRGLRELMMPHCIWRVRVYDMSGRRGDTDSPWRGRQKFHTRYGQSRRRIRQFVNRKKRHSPGSPREASRECYIF
jgi:hypothetical protein